MKMEVGYIYPESQIILQRAACGTRATGWPLLAYIILEEKYFGMNILRKRFLFK